ncbi:MAG TPA: cyclic nucleotide-binding domain-containing protein [Bdellovibrionota bacterium]|nr:cyclic nucleotide-binding domain-containing protein [Bdellovibrionota bacterium]
MGMMLAVSPNGDFVASIPLALTIGPKSLTDWKRRIPPSRYKAGQVLFYRGHLPYGLFVIHEGAVELRITEKDLHAPLKAGPGAMLGLASLVANQPYPLTALVVNDVLVSFTEKSTLLHWIQHSDPLLVHELKFLKGGNEIKRKSARKSV